jgi:hypothetical protein
MSRNGNKILVENNTMKQILKTLITIWILEILVVTKIRTKTMNNTSQSSKQLPSQPSTLWNMKNEGNSGAISPSPAAKNLASIVANKAPGAEDVVAQGLSAACNVVKEFSKGLMVAAYIQLGSNSGAVLQDIMLQRVIRAVRQRVRVVDNQAETVKGGSG